MSKSVQEIAKIAAEWWADKIVNPRFDNGDSGLGGAFAMVMASSLVKEVDSNQRNMFIQILSESIVNILEERDNLVLSVDYHPDMILCDAGSKSNISVDNFPWKTTMWMDNDHISVSYGYNGREQFLYANKSFWAKRIESCKDTIQRCDRGEYYSYIKDEEKRQRYVLEMVLEQKDCIKKYEASLETAEE